MIIISYEKRAPSASHGSEGQGEVNWACKWELIQLKS